MTEIKRQGTRQTGTATLQSTIRTRRRQAAWVTGIALAIATVFLLAGCANQPAATVPNQAIHIEGVRLTAAGHYVDLRYRVLDAEEARKFISPGVKPKLIDDATGIEMAVPMTAKLGSLRQTRGEQRPDHLYFILFVNAAGLKRGSTVTAEIGDVRFENLTVQ